MKEYQSFRLIPEDEDVLLGEFDDGRVMKSKIEEINNQKRNGVFEEVKNQGQWTINTCWVVMEKMKEGKAVCKVRLVARGFEEYNNQLQTEASTCLPETLKLCIAKILQEGWTVKSITVKTSYLQGNRIDREVYLKPMK